MDRRDIHEDVPIKKIRLWDESNVITHAGSPLVYREVVLSGTNGSTFNLPKPIQYIKSVKLQECYIPALLYNITSTQTVVQTNNTGSLTSVVLTEGLYTQADVVAAFTAAGSTTLAISSNTGLATITFAVDDADHTVDFSAATTLQSLLGFTSAVNVSATTVVTGDIPANFYPINNIFIRSNALTRMYVDNVLSTTSAADQNVAFTVPMRESPQPGYYFYEHPADRGYMSCHGGDVHAIDIQLTDESGNVLDLHSLPYTLKIAFKTEDFMRR